MNHESVRVHDLRGLTAKEVYDETQTNEDINAGDVLLTNRGIAIMYSAWPTMVFGSSRTLHILKKGSTWLDVLHANNCGIDPVCLRDGLLVAWAIACG